MMWDELGSPNITLGVSIVCVVVDNRPDWVNVNVITDGGGDVVGRAETFPNVVLSPNIGLYVVFASPVGTMAPCTAVMEMLNA